MTFHVLMLCAAVLCLSLYVAVDALASLRRRHHDHLIAGAPRSVRKVH